MEECALGIFSSFINRPKILVNDGHLVLESARDRNITFRVLGNGKVHFPTSSDASAAGGDHVVIGGGGSFGNVRALEERVRRLEETVNADPGLARRLRAIDERISPLQSRHASDDASATTTATQLDRMKRRVRSLTRALRQVLARVNADDCASNPCSNGGTCVNTFHGYFCQCPENWEGVRCDEDVNECSRFQGTDLGCQNGATCQNLPGAYRFELYMLSLPAILHVSAS